jgi:hypothetical protein
MTSHEFFSPRASSLLISRMRKRYDFERVALLFELTTWETTRVVFKDRERTGGIA